MTLKKDQACRSFGDMGMGLEFRNDYIIFNKLKFVENVLGEGEASYFTKIQCTHSLYSLGQWLCCGLQTS